MNRVCSIFSQLLQLFSRAEFERAVKDHKAERHARGFASWCQLVAMLFCQLGRAHSLREICGGLACCEGKLKHSAFRWRRRDPPWLTPTNTGPGTVPDGFTQLLGKCQELVAAQGGRKKFRFKNKLMSLDGSVIDLSVSLFDWAKFRRTKGRSNYTCCWTTTATCLRSRW